MEIINIFQKPLLKKPTALALGLFDGVHIGHRALLRETVKAAKENALVPAVFTFCDTAYKHASALFTREATYRMMEELGIERIYEADFSHIASFSPARFAADILTDICTPVCLFCGDSFRFGKGAKGTPETLFGLLSRGEGLVVLPPVLLEGEVVSSSLIREALTEGNIEKANRALGFPYTLQGEVKEGKGLGRALAYPTVNIEIPPSFTVPRRGVYISLTQIGDKEYPSVSNIGRRPTVEHTEKDNCETHLLSAAGNFYGQAVSVKLLSFMREEQVFQNVTDLSAHIALDVKHAKTYFKLA